MLGLELQLAEKAKAVEEVASLTSSAEDIAPAPAPEELGELKMELQNQIMKLESLVSAHRLRDAADPRLVGRTFPSQGLFSNAPTCFQVTRTSVTPATREGRAEGHQK